MVVISSELKSMSINNINRDEDGFLLNLDDWSKDVAVLIAKEEGILLTKDHWVIINLLREHYKKYKTTLAIRALIKLITKELGEEKGKSIYLQKLFFNSPALQANKIAGLPKPVRCI